MNKFDEILEQLGLTKTIDIPVRRKGLTGSGKYNQCHSNVSNLVHYFGGQKVCGYIKNPFQNFFGFTHYISHSVWVTPEGKFADVTAHHYSKDAISNFLYPVAYDDNRNIFLPEFLISNASSKKEIFASYRSLTDQIKKSKKLEVVEIDNIRFLKFTYKKLDVRNLAIKLPRLYGAEWDEFLSEGGFDLPSTATRKEWVQIRKEYSR